MQTYSYSSKNRNKRAKGLRAKYTMSAVHFYYLAYYRNDPLCLGFSRLFDPFPIDRNFQVDETFTLEAQGLRWGRRGNCDRCVKPSTPRGVKEIINGRMKCGEFGHLTRFSVRKTGNGRGQTILCSIINF